MLVLVGAGVLALVAISCSGGTADNAGSPTTHTGPPTFDDVDAAMTRRVADEGLDGGAVLVVQHGHVIHRAIYGQYHGDETISIASASKWLTAATLMTLVDDGKLTLDDPITRWLPAFAAHPDMAPVTLRQLLAHLSGIDQDDCIWDRSTTLAACTDDIAGTKLVSEPGRQFNYGNTDYQVAARLGEVASGQSFQDLFFDRIARPLAMTSTRFDEGDPTDNPTPAASGRSSLDDYAHFLELMAGGGMYRGARILSEASVHEMLHDQTAGHENADDFAVRITGVPRYGLGMWLDRDDDHGDAVVASGSGSLGFYPWVDRAHDSYGIVEVEDHAGGDGRAVRESQRVCNLAIGATPPT
jgi:CubicO group peptidase (beta-lactamase class C family)